MSKLMILSAYTNTRVLNFVFCDVYSNTFEYRRRLKEEDPAQGRRHLPSGNCNHCRGPPDRRRLNEDTSSGCSCVYQVRIHGEIVFMCGDHEQFNTTNTTANSTFVNSTTTKQNQLSFMSIGWDSALDFFYSGLYF